MNKTIGIILGVIIVGAIVWAITASNKPADNKMMADENVNTMMEDKNTETKDAMMEEKKDDTMMDKKDEGAMMEKSGSYKDYSSATLASEQAAGNKVVLFFHATWCPYCKAADAVFTSRPKEIPAGVVVLKTDYDSQKELKTKYGVTTQHTFVQIDANGNQIAKWVSGDTKELTANLK